MQYKQQETESQSSFSPVLLLPAVTNSVGNEDKQLSILGISGIQKSGCAKSATKAQGGEAKCFEGDARNYHDLAERLKKENRENMAHMSHKL